MMGFGPLSGQPIADSGTPRGAAFVGGASVSFAGNVIVQGRASFIGIGTIRSLKFGAAAFIGLGTLSVVDGRLRQGRAALSAAATLRGRARNLWGSAAAFLGTAATALDPLQRIYAATRGFITTRDDTPVNQPFEGTLQKVIRFDRSILNGSRIGQVTAGWGEMELINAEGEYDALIAKYAVDGRRIVVRVGPVGAAYSAFQTLFEGTATDWNLDENVMRIQVRDNTYRLEVPAQPLLYGGTGGLDGTGDLKGKRRPLALGECQNVTPDSVIPTEGVYAVNGGPVYAIPAVYDRAVALTYRRDYATSAALRAATTGLAGSGSDIEAGQYATCLAEGLFRLGGQPFGSVTCDVQGDATGGVYVNTTASILRRVVARATDVKDPSGLYAASFQAVEAAQPAVVGYFLDGARDVSVADLIADMMGAVGGYGGMRRNGRLEIGIFTAPAGSPTALYDRVDIVSIDRQKLPSGLSPPPYRFRVAWGRNNTVQTDVAGQSAVSAARVAFLAEERRLATSDAATGMRVKVNHPLAQDPEPVEAYFRDEAPALAEANRLLALYGPTSSLYRITLKVHPFTHEIGEVVQVTYPRWDLKAGRLLRIVSITDDTDSDQIEIVGFG